MTPFTIYLCENQPVVIEGLTRILEGCPDMRLVGHGPDLAFAVEELESTSADILLLSQPPSAKSILPLLGTVREADLHCATVLWVTELGEMESLRALQIGARGIVRKTQSIATLLDCLRTVAGGAAFLDEAMRAKLSGTPRRHGTLRITPRERQIVQSVCRGLKNKEIAAALSITPGTVKVHLMHVFEKTGVKDRFQLALQARQFLDDVEGDARARNADH